MNKMKPKSCHWNVLLISAIIFFSSREVLKIRAFATNQNSRRGNVCRHSHIFHQVTTESPLIAITTKCKPLHATSADNDDWCIDDESDGLGDCSSGMGGRDNSKSKENDQMNHDYGSKNQEMYPDEDPTNENKIEGENDEVIREYFATCIPGLQNILASELTALGAIDVTPTGLSGVAFAGTSKVGLSSILWCRTAHKIMELIASSPFSMPIRSSDDLYEFTKSSIHTPTLLGDGQGGLLTISVNTIYTATVPKELCHGHFTALTVKNALVDSVRELREDGDRPDVDVDDSDVPLVVVLKGRRIGGDRWSARGGGRSGRGGRGGDRRGRGDFRGGYEEEIVADVDLYRCLHSGGSLHRRGYRSGGMDMDLGKEWGNDDLEDEDNEWGENPNSNIRRQMDSSSAPIHRAAMKESLAAGLLLEAGWDKLTQAARSDGMGAVLIDPMTGSATLPTEAALIACDMAPGLLRIASWRGNSSGGNQGRNPHRIPPAVRWKDFCEMEEWGGLLADAMQRTKAGMKWARSLSKCNEDGDEAPKSATRKNVEILCNEKNPRACSLARMSIANSGVGSIISLHEGDCLDWNIGGINNDTHGDRRAVVEGRTMFVCNPPWGVRLTEDIDASWVSLREFLRREGHGAEAWVLSGNKDLTKILRMKRSRTLVVRTADEDLRWLQYHIFQKSEVSA